LEVPCIFASLRLRVEFRRQRAGSKRNRPVLKAGLIDEEEFENPTCSTLCRAALAQHPQRARSKRQEQQRARDGIDAYPGCVLVFDYAG
jgi:hypothetical protein